MNLVTIASGWYNYTKGTPETQKMMALRLAICDGCPKKMPMSPAGQLLIRTINKEGSTYLCGGCNGCPLATKTAAPLSTCPLKKWGVYPPPEESYYP